ncbi:hypothetical protein PCANC_16268 [Puccinia coronata f. sp. avenae]|uniref:Uncharacterized protein n=1 Tax=Puccinia coronata f. sp. avenae TaxID=200324 RepID=A0A2N5U7P4_9BASI|nr:hypothetical protein PCANC_16268 [Puccinia coronata f. sp. avenae]
MCSIRHGGLDVVTQNRFVSSAASSGLKSSLVNCSTPYLVAPALRTTMLHPVSLIWTVVTLVVASLDQLKEEMPHRSGCPKNTTVFATYTIGECPVDGCNQLGFKRNQYYDCLDCRCPSDTLVEQAKCETHLRPGEPPAPFTTRSGPPCSTPYLVTPALHKGMFHPASLLYVIITLVDANPTELQETITHKEHCVKNNDLFTIPAEQKCPMDGCNRLARKETLLLRMPELPAHI